MDDLERQLATDSEGWTRPIVRRRYEASPRGEEAARHEARLLLAHGYSQTGAGHITAAGHTNVRRTVARTVLTGGIGLLLFGTSRSDGRQHLTAAWMLDGEPYQPRQVTVYANTFGLGVEIDSVARKLSGIFKVAFEYGGELMNSGGMHVEQAEIEVAVYRVPDLERIEVARTTISDLPPGTRRPWRLKPDGRYVAGVKATESVVVRRLMPLNGVWQDPHPVRVLWADAFPASEYNRAG